MFPIQTDNSTGVDQFTIQELCAENACEKINIARKECEDTTIRSEWSTPVMRCTNATFTTSIAKREVVSYAHPAVFQSVIIHNFRRTEHY